MISKMKFVNITGPKADIDRVVDTYLTVYPIHLENALSELKTADNLKPYVENNPYKEIDSALTPMAKLANQGNMDFTPTKTITLAEAQALLDTISEKSAKLNEQKQSLEQSKAHYQELMKNLEPFKMMDFPISDIFELKFIKYRFGRIALNYFDKFSKYVYENLNTIFCEFSRNEDFVYGVYFAPQSTFVKVDAVFASMHFERIKISGEFDGPPCQIWNKVEQLMAQNQAAIDDCNRQLSHIYTDHVEAINNAYASMHNLLEIHDVRKKAACTKERFEIFYILCGWMEEKVAKKFSKAVDGDDNVYVIIDEDHDSTTTSKPPTKLTNRGFFKPFQMFVSMYGLPNYKEVDPTKFVALTYALMFGVMFGDVGQGACLVIGGFLLYKFRHMAIAGIISFCGLFSVFFGFMYGSFFGYEHILPTLWMKPMESENMMTMLMLAVAFGVVLILVAMIIHMINAVKRKDYGALLVGTNGFTGMIFYLAVIYIVVTKLLPAIGPTRFMTVLIILIAVCLFCITFAEPLADKINKKRFVLHDSKAMFVVQSIFELVEILLSYMTNTISFIRVGAFALSHAGMMSVVMMLAKAENGTTPVGMIVVILGNILIAGLEGLIVGIQVLRLEYYEMFSRFYSGTGRPFKPFH